MTMSTEHPPEPGELRLSPLVASQFGYHVRMTAVFALAGQTEESGAEAVLAWAILDSTWSDGESSTAAAGADLVDQRVAGLSESSRSAAVARARGLALDIQAHFVTTGQHDVANLYAHVAEHLDEAAAALVPDR